MFESDKALWGGGDPIGAGLFGGSVSWPALVLRESALAHNLAALAQFCAAHDLAFAPHGKTTMSPELFARQLAAGAWGITVATAHQAVLAHRWGVRRVLLANELLDAVALGRIAAILADDPGWEFHLLVDSPAGVAAAARAGRAHGVRLSVLIDVGWTGGRTGVRGVPAAARLAKAAAGSDGVRLAGIGGYEGGLPDAERVINYFADVRAAAEAVREYLPPEPIVTAGGSAYFDLVASELGGAWAARTGARIVLRSGTYLTHDDGVYVRKTALNRIAREGSLRPALELWGQVISTPEPGLALLGLGKRDAPYDEGMPVVKAVRRDGAVLAVGQITVPKMDDQHCYLQLADGVELVPGDLVCLGISHPCTAFDKWRAIPIVDDGDRITEVVRTYF